ncbi:hypothetical protein P171DRAFT_484575 [Karstenula rhodostoma CBS 690.94]|uniref:Uncharacterized protein n=1 Tax=Karstenula rhodostoma CBS 690.94 TaxID=1392251 RepID=A0A9P4PMB1_9PLEO|nr:hypothetical protein P171DRAFT_484575 [Karstenula rhodostoma CBS 690.94]
MSSVYWIGIRALDADCTDDSTIGKESEQFSLVSLYAYAFEKASNLRQTPKRTPALPTDIFEVTEEAKNIAFDIPQLTAIASVVKGKEGRRVSVSGRCKGQELVLLSVYVDDDEIENVKLEGGQWTLVVSSRVFELDEREKMLYLTSRK